MNIILLKNVSLKRRERKCIFLKRSPNSGKVSCICRSSQVLFINVWMTSKIFAMINSNMNDKDLLVGDISCEIWYDRHYTAQCLYTRTDSLGANLMWLEQYLRYWKQAIDKSNESYMFVGDYISTIGVRISCLCRMVISYWRRRCLQNIIMNFPSWMKAKESAIQLEV